MTLPDVPHIRRRARLLTNFTYLISTLPLATIWFVLLTTLYTVGMATAVVWVGVPIFALALMLTRSVGRWERRRANALLGADITLPYRPVAGGFRARLAAMLRDDTTWADLSYALVLLPISVIEFALTLTLWVVSLHLITLPVVYRFLPRGRWSFPAIVDGPHWIVVSSLEQSLPWVVLGIVLLALAVAVTLGLGRTHRAIATALLRGHHGR